MIEQVQQGGYGFQVCAKTGLITTINAGSGTAGHIFALRWAPAAGLAPFLRLTHLNVKWWTIAGFTAAQEVGLDCFRVTGYTAAHTGGTAVSTASPNLKKRTGMPTGPGASPISAIADMRVATTGELTAGTHTFDATPFATGTFSELAAAATVPKGFFEIEKTTDDLEKEPLILDANEGIVIRVTITMGAGGTARVAVEPQWKETFSR